jgi:hypothetical protein
MTKKKSKNTSPKTIHPFKLRPHVVTGQWVTKDARYREYAHELLSELEALCAELKIKYPPKKDTTIQNEKEYPTEYIKLLHLRDRTSDSVRLYAAMSVEGFLNFYGVLRLGQKVFDEHFERLGLIPKLKSLLLLCDALKVDEKDSLVVLLIKIAESRNNLVHPKTKEIDHTHKTDPKNVIEIPKKAQQAVENMEAFFEKFALAVPEAGRYIKE